MSPRNLILLLPFLLAAALTTAPTSQPTTQPTTRPAATKPAKPIVYDSIFPILNKIPADLRPSNLTGWDKYAYPTACEWIESQGAGIVIQCPTRIDKIGVSRNAQSKSPADAFRISITTTNRDFNFAGTKSLFTIPNDSFTVDQATAKKYDTPQPTRFIKFTGTIVKITIDPISSAGGPRRPPIGLKYNITYRDTSFSNPLSPD